MTTTTAINVGDMHCSSCSSKITAALIKSCDVIDVKVNAVKRDIFVTHNSGVATSDLLDNISELGFSPRLLNVLSAEAPQDRTLLKRLGVAGICMMQAMMVQIALYAGAFSGMDLHLKQLLSYTALIFAIPVLTYSAIPFFVNGFGRIKHGVNMDTPIALALTIAFVVSLHNVLRGTGDVYFDSVSMFVFLMLAARYLNERIRHKLHLEDQLIANLPREVMKLDRMSNKNILVPLSDIERGDHLWVNEGEAFPVDGYLLSPKAQIDASLLTGESDAKTCKKGDILYAGTMNLGAGVCIETRHPADDSRVAQIDALASEASAQKGSQASLADSIARVFIPAILAIACVTFAYWSVVDVDLAVRATLAVLVISCPCALSLAIPAASAAALTYLRRIGLLVRDSAALERILAVRSIFFDKTGTLTTPSPRIVAEQTLGPWSARTCREYAIALQQHSRHPFARAFCHEAHGTAHVVSDVVVVGGQGVEGRINDAQIRIGSAQFCGVTESRMDPQTKAVYLSIGGHPAARFELSLPLRDDAAPMVKALKNRGLEVAILSGDQHNQCAQIATELDIGFVNDATPESKRAHLLAHEPSMFVGDGLNDLPALSTAAVSVATLETMDLVKSKADVLMMNAKLGNLTQLFNTAKRTRSVTRQNLAWALLYNVCAIPLAASGLATPWLAALGMSLSSILVMLNASRLIRPAEE